MAKETAKKPAAGEETRRQVTGTVGGIEVGFASAAVLPGTFQVYRAMRGNPTIALARMAATAPVRAAGWAVEGKEGVSEEWIAFIEDDIASRWAVLVKDMLYALDYGFAAFEKVWVARPDGKWGYAKIKPLMPELTEILVDKDTGAFLGLKQDNITLPENKSFLFTNDLEAGELHGRARHENCRVVWSQWKDILTKTSQYVNKSSGVIPMIEYPEGQSKDATGQQVDNFQHAKRMLAELGRGHGVYMPNTLAQFAEDLVRQGVDIAQLKAWHISFLEAKSAHGAEFVEMMRHLESLMMRGWLVPERTATEGSHGTLAEATAHAGLALVVSNLLLQDIARYINWYLIDPLLAVNFGEDTRGDVFVTTEQLGSDERVWFRDLIKAVMTNPMNIGLLQSMVDLDVLLDVAGLPKQAGAADMTAEVTAVAERLARGDLPASAQAALMGIYQSVLQGVRMA